MSPTLEAKNNHPTEDVAELVATLYTEQDGEPWGVWCHGHQDKAAFLRKANEVIKAVQYLYVSLDEVEHSYAHLDKSLPSDCQMLISTPDHPDSFPITWVKGEHLVYTREKYTGHYQVPKLQENQTYYCTENGHGNCQIKVVEENNLTIRDTDDLVIEREYSKEDVASCCGGEVGIWDNASDLDVPFEFQFVPAQ